MKYAVFLGVLAGSLVGIFSRTARDSVTPLAFSTPWVAPAAPPAPPHHVASPVTRGKKKISRPRFRGSIVCPPHSYSPNNQRGEICASWYGPGFHGRKTASGEVFDMHKVSAAHNHWGFGTKVRLRNPEDGRTLDVVINDRGPFWMDRRLDLSFRAAELLGVAEAGAMKLEYERLN